jgi:hypothetical protein
MTSDPAAPGQGSRNENGTVILIGFVVILAAGAGFWVYRSTVITRNAAEVSIAEYLQLKEEGHIREVRLEGEDLTAEIAGGGFVCDGRSYKHIHCIVPPAYLVDPKGFAELRSGLSPSQFIHTPR